MKAKKLAYLVGALRDGSIFYYERGRNYTCVWYESSRRWLQSSICPRLKEVFGTNAKLLEYKPGQIRARIYSKEAFECFKNVYGYRSPQKNWGTQEIVRAADDSVISLYIAGFFDAEGDISQKDAVLGFSQKNYESLDFIRDWLARHGLKPSKIFIADKKSHTLRFYISSRNELGLFKKLVPFEHPDKAKLMERRLQLT